MQTYLSKVFRLGLDSSNFLLWPAVCCVCGKSVEEQDGCMCKRCWEKMASFTVDDFCPSCGKSVSEYALIDGKCPECDESDLLFEKITRVGKYGGVLRELILKIKHTESPETTRILSYQLLCAIESHLPTSEIDFFAPVPLHWRRKLMRGYNQSTLLLSSTKKDGFDVRNVLGRNRYTMPQPGLTYSQRRKNIKGAFYCKKSNFVSGKTICLVDDIKTTGATLSECSRVLKENGAKKVYAAVIAVT